MGKTITSFLMATALALSLIPANAAATNPIPADLTAHQFVERMGMGWNLGNTFDAFNGSQAPGASFNSNTAAAITNLETSWVGSGNATTRTLVQEIKRQGFNTIRIPVTWHKVANPNNNWQINDLWMDRVQEVVD